MIEIRWHGRGGQGAFTAAKILGAASLIDNKYSLAFPSFGPERRGAPIQAFNKIDNRTIINRSEIKVCDYLIFLDDSLFSLDYLKDLKNNGIALINTATPDKFSNFSQIRTIDANQIALKIIKKPLSNTAMLGALASISDNISLSSLQEASTLYFSTAHITKNQLILQESYDHFKEVH